MNESLNNLFESMINQDALIYMVLSKVKKGEEKTFLKVDVKPIIMKDARKYHLTYHYEKKDIHENLSIEEMIIKFDDLMAYFRQAMIYSVDGDHQILISKKGKVKVISKPPTREMSIQGHNRKKTYILPEDEYSDFLFELGIMQENGTIKKNKYDKYRQLNRYLEFISDSLVYLDQSKTIKIIDFGCGKAYLTFALYHYLVEKMNYKVEIIGLDLKEDVIDFCNDLAMKLKYEDLTFIKGDIKNFNHEDDIDMVISLHACDTATDEALAKAIQWDAKVILAVPCCQHELFGKIKSEENTSLLKYGIIKDKLASLITDTFRATALEIMGYQTQVLEFIDLEHTPKNILIRAYKKDQSSELAVKEFNALKEAWGVVPYIENALGKEFYKRISNRV